MMRNPKPNSETLTRQFPRRCAECGQGAVQRTLIAYEAEVKHDGKLYKFEIPELKIEQCSNCGEQYFDAETDYQISAGLRSHLGLLQPDEIRQELEALELTQRDFAEHLRVAPESVSRWLTGASIQSRSLDTLMRIYFRFPHVRATLNDPAALAKL